MRFLEKWWPGLPPGHGLFVKSMPPSLSESKVTPSFCFPFKIPDDPTATSTYPVHRSQTESLIWKFTHFFTTISSWFFFAHWKKGQVSYVYHNGTKYFVRSNKIFYSYDLTKHPLKFQRVYSSVHELQMQPLKVFNSIVYQYKGT